MSGVEVIRALKRYSSDLAVIAITGFPDLETTVQSMRLGVFDYIAKPFDLVQIFEAVENALDQQRRTRDLVRNEEMSRLQAELLLHMSHEFKDAIHHMEGQSKELMQLVSDILELPKRSPNRQPNNRLEWQDVLNRLARLAKPKAKANVLVVDDDPGLVELLAYILTKEGYAVESVGDGKAALEALSRHKPDFMILDLMMPKLNGFEVLDALAKTPALKDLPVVILTARYLTSQEKASLKKRVEGIVQKGQSDIREILDILRERSCAFRSLSDAA
jgi:DNA-binding response OmpR family regulator